MRNFIHTTLLALAKRFAPPAPVAPLLRAPRQLEEARELTAEERDQLAGFLKSTAGLALIERARAIEFRDYQSDRRATWRQCVDWIISLSRVPRDNGDEFQTDTEAIGESQFRERISP